ncbi:MAG: hypothetical protein ACRDF4_07440, partial [Rhabdochlamydiaceae bacterium]
FGAVLSTASYSNILKNSPQVISADLSMLASTGAGTIRIDVDYGPWLTKDQAAISEMTSVVQSVRSEGLKLVIADAAAENYRSNLVPWNQFQAAWIQRVKTLSALYHPDYYIIIKEPGWYVSMVSNARMNPDFQNVNSWLNLTNALTRAVLSESPTTKVGIAVAADSLGSNPKLYVPYLQGVERLPQISFIGFDIYTTTGFSTAQAFLKHFGSGGKNVWIAEAWSGTSSVAFSSSREQLDASWIKALYYFAESQVHASMIIPFYTNDFSQYSLTNSISSSLFFNPRTPVFYAYQSIVASNIAH